MLKIFGEIMGEINPQLRRIEHCDGSFVYHLHGKIYLQLIQVNNEVEISLVSPKGRLKITMGDQKNLSSEEFKTFLKDGALWEFTKPINSPQLY